MSDEQPSPLQAAIFLAPTTYSVIREVNPEFSVPATSVMRKDDGKLSDWAYYSAAVVGGLILSASESFPGEHQKIIDELNDKDPGLINHVDDFIDFLKQTPERNEFNILVGLVGLWFLWNLTGARPTDEELVGPGSDIGYSLLKVAGYSPPSSQT